MENLIAFTARVMACQTVVLDDSIGSLVTKVYKRLQIIDAAHLICVEVYMLGKHEIYMWFNATSADNIVAAVRRPPYGSKNVVSAW